MKYVFLLLIILPFLPLKARGHVISGVVYSIEGKQSDTTELIGASICLIKNLDISQKGTPCLKGTQTDLDGKFEIICDSTFKYIEVSYRGSDYSLVKINDDTINLKIYVTLKNDSIVLTPIYPLGPSLNKSSYVGKPAIYLYPTKPTTISIQHDFKGAIGTTYPDYKNGWHVKAKPNGTILNMADNRQYEYLFWDGSCTFPDAHFAFKTGFVVHRKDLTDFFLNKLTLIGLNNKEMNDFIVYWLPMLNKHETNFIHFRINDNIDNASVLTVNPKPESWIRLFMEYKEVSKDFTIPEQELKKLPRKGFTLVEWGGSRIEQILKIL